MPQRKTIFAVLTLIAVLTIAYALWTKNGEEPVQLPQKTYELQADDQGEVTVVVQPLDISEQSNVWRFQVTLNTHSRELNEDISQAAELRNNKDERFETLGWEEESLPTGRQAPGGHHRSGVLIFRPFLPFPSEIILRLRNVGGIPERVFTWHTTPPSTD